MTGTDGEYERLLHWAYCGEVFGAVVVRELIDSRAYPAQATPLQLFFELEDTTRQGLEQLVEPDRLVAAGEQARIEGLRYAHNAARLSWRDLMTETATMSGAALPDFHRLRQLGPSAASAILDAAVEHEECLLRFATLSSAGDQPGADNTIRHFLETHPGPATTARTPGRGPAV
ncbi:hypothetical protein AXA44_44255 [Rhodococcus sp. SC4]|nr:hypothetical protein AXA44_44255 [Rhodococcus sp. SC4]